MKLEGFQQSIQYEGGSGRLWYKPTLEGKETVPDAAPTISIIDPGGTELVATTNMTRDALTAWYYYDVDAENTTSYGLGLDYQAEIVFEVNSVEYIDRMIFDVCRWPIGQPLLTSEVIDKKRPTWAASRPVEWGLDWSEPIKDAHREMVDELRGIMGSKGEFIRPHLILTRAKLHAVAMKFTLYEIAEGIGLPEDEKNEYRDRRNNAIDAMGPVSVDYDDDLLVDSDEDDQTLGGVVLRR